MSFRDFFKEKLPFILTQAVVILFLIALFSALRLGTYLGLFVSVLIIGLDTIIVLIEYLRKRAFYQELRNLLAQTEQKYLIGGMLDEADFCEGRILVDSIQSIKKSMNDQLARYQIAQNEYRDYIETWIHEVKIPISCVELICENNKSPVTSSIFDEISKVEGYVEQALYYARSVDLEKDYSISNMDLDAIVKSALKKHAKQLIASHTRIALGNLQYTVYSDPKWIDFTLSQLLSNSLKYRKEELALSISASEADQYVELTVADNGIGIASQDLERVFQKGFTGENGRKYAKSTGMGLYLCHSLCEKMHLGISLSSIQGQGTTVRIQFPKNKTIFFEP